MRATGASLALLLALSACTGATRGAPDRTGLPGSSWRLVEFQSSDDRIGVVRPANPSRYTMRLEPEGQVAMALDCNRAVGTWSAVPAGDESGSFTFGPLAMTRALCPPPSMDTQVARDAEHVRTYVLRGGRLYLNLWADAGTYVWERM